ncbi:myosin phosphatase Rho-interacting protein-like [Meles meles]|uniref:myosin phosphatase Rho-interacting protein-like n=1 Tax=Meles meles TaxID=9662 RepID=UPI001E6987D8|nr:myosin phosphatase Rho-interacting protein-like [Meles meles]
MASPSMVVGQGAWGGESGGLGHRAVRTAYAPCGRGGPGKAGVGQAWQCGLKGLRCNSTPSPPQAGRGALSPPQQPRVLYCRRSQVIEKFEALDIEKAEHMETNLSAGPSPSSDTRQGRSEKRAFPRKRDLPSEAPTAHLPDTSASPLSPHRRAKSLDRRSTESSLTPDLLNFKKGWLTKQYEDGQTQVSLLATHSKDLGS